MMIWKKNFYHTTKLQKQAYDKAIKLKNYAFNNKIWLNYKYIQTKQNYKLETKFFGSFWVLYSVRNQVYKFELTKKYRIHNIIYISLLEYDTTKKKRVNKTIIQLQFETRDNNEKYKIGKIQDNAIYVRESENYLLNFYYLVL